MPIFQHAGDPKRFAASEERFPLIAITSIEEASFHAFEQAAAGVAFAGAVALSASAATVFLLPLVPDPRHFNVADCVGLLPSVGHFPPGEGQDTGTGHQNLCRYWGLDPRDCIGFAILKTAELGGNMEFQSLTLNAAKFDAPAPPPGLRWGRSGKNAYTSQAWALEIAQCFAQTYNGAVEPRGFTSAAKNQGRRMQPVVYPPTGRIALGPQAPYVIAALPRGRHTA